MYSTSADFITALHAPARFERLRGTIGATPFDDSNVISLSYSNRCSDTADVTLGSCYIGQLEATLTGLSIPRGEWRNQEISLEWGLVLEDESLEYIPVGVFTINEATWSGTGVSVKASDNIAKLDKACSPSTTVGEIYDLLLLACQECGLTLAQTQADIRALPNGTEMFSLYPNNDIKTWRDYVSWVCQLFGGFAYADRTGKLAVKSWANLSVVDSLTDTERELQTTFSDYTTAYNGISVVNIADQTTSVYMNELGYGAIINLGSNPFVQYGKEDLITQRQTIADVVEDIQYTPFNSGVLSNMAYDLGDLLTCSGGIAGTGTLTCCVMSIDWTSKNLTTLQGFGADPSLATGKSKTDKAISGLISRTSENQVIIHTFENSQAFTLGDEEEVEILTIRFATVSPKVINIWHEIELDVTADPLGDGVVSCQAFYYLDGDLITYSPITTWNNDGFHLLHLLYFLSSLEGGTLYEWKVALIISGGTATIARGNIHASLYGQGLVATDEWDGIIEVSDSMSVTLGSAYTTSLTESVTVDEDVQPEWWSPINLTDSMSVTLGSAYTVNLADDPEPTIVQEFEYNAWVNEDASKFVTDEGKVIYFRGHTTKDD